MQSIFRAKAEAARVTTHPTETKSGVYYKAEAGGITPANLEILAKPRPAWRTLCKSVVEQAEGDRINRLIEKRELRKRRAGLITSSQPP